MGGEGTTKKKKTKENDTGWEQAAPCAGGPKSGWNTTWRGGGCRIEKKEDDEPKWKEANTINIEYI